MKSYKEWPKKYRLLLVFAWGLFIFFLCLSRGYTEEKPMDRVMDLAKDAAIDTLVTTVTMIGAAEQAAMGNFGTGLALATISGTEYCRAYSEAKEAWYLYHNTYEASGTGDVDISPAQGDFDHGRD